ncbi:MULTISPECIES: DUF421 domain-containing protein [Allobacillus]|uniref:DUF421 domain-containing protein n=1 Tax=Allobacillus salarius TaxID=1955272 RepID=A0A556PSX2_9BACI|nr:DUF421 domain-containing protein [Allobacillus salarius]TSJ67498.1 DUF421 domain-containing protein [Allobacillus salarius]
MVVVWESLLMVVAGLFLLRFAGRKSISQMSLAQTVVMISIGSIIIQPIVESSVWRTLLAASMFILALIIMEYLQVKFNFMENFITGKSKIVIEQGELKTKNMKKLRFTVDQLEMRLRQQGINRLSDVKTATLEPNGQLGYELYPDARPLTVGEFKELMSLYTGLQVQQNRNNLQQTSNIFDEMKQNTYTPQSPDQLK